MLTYTKPKKVMGGSITLNPSSPFYLSQLKPALSGSHKNEYYAGDAAKLLSNSADYLSRSTILNRNARAIADLAFSYSSSSSSSSPSQANGNAPNSTNGGGGGGGGGIVRSVLYPPYTPTLQNYTALTRPPTPEFTPGHGCLLSIEFIDKETAIRFYNNLHVHKGPHLGAHLTLAMPYNEMVWGSEEIVKEGYHAGYGLLREQVRVSVGLEKEEELVEVFRAAFGAALGADVEGVAK